MSYMSNKNSGGRRLHGVRLKWEKLKIEEMENRWAKNLKQICIDLNSKNKCAWGTKKTTKYYISCEGTKQQPSASFSNY